MIYLLNVFTAGLKSKFKKSSTVLIKLERDIKEAACHGVKSFIWLLTCFPAQNLEKSKFKLNRLERWLKITEWKLSEINAKYD